MLLCYGSTTSPRSVNSPRWRRRSALALSAASVARCTRSPCPGRALRCRGTPLPPPPSSIAVAGVYRRVSAHGTLLRSAQDVVSLHPSFSAIYGHGISGRAFDHLRFAAAIGDSVVLFREYFSSRLPAQRAASREATNCRLEGAGAIRQGGRNEFIASSISTPTYISQSARSTHKSRTK